MNKSEIKNSVHSLISEFYKSRIEEFVPGKTKIGVGGPIFDDHEVNRAIDCFLSGWITQGKNVNEFESMFAKYFGVKHAVSVNSGSSANLLGTLIPLLAKRIKKGGKVIVPATTFPTMVSPIIQLGLKPVFVDVDPKTYNLDINEVEKIVKNEKIDMIIPVHLFGNPVNMGHLMEIALENDIFILEDCAEAHGAEYENKKVGSFGDIAVFSFFVAHHMTTAEGGMLITNNSHYANLARSLRAFGRACNCPICTYSQGKTCQMRMNFDDPILKNYDKRQLFLYLGYSLKMTEVPAAFGIEQLKKLPYFIKKRQENAEYIINKLKPYEELIQLPTTTEKGTNTYYGLPLVINKNSPFSRLDLTTFLEKHKIETRPFFGGSLPDQPAFRNEDIIIKGDLSVAKWIRDNAFFIGCHPGITEKERDYQKNVLFEFLDMYK